MLDGTSAVTTDLVQIASHNFHNRALRIGAGKGITVLLTIKRTMIRAYSCIRLFLHDGIPAVIWNVFAVRVIDAKSSGES